MAQLPAITHFNLSLVSKIMRIISIDNGYLGSHNDEERSETRYVLRIAEFSESSKF